MPRSLRVDVGGEIYHCLNRTVGKQQIFFTRRDYVLFEKILEEVVDITDIKILAYCLMPNHFHLVVRTEEDGDLSDFMKRITVTHTQRYRAVTDTVGEGPLYQGRYKSFIIENNNYLTTVLRYVERNPLTAKLIKKPLMWRYSSLYRRYQGTEREKKLLTTWPIEEPKNYLNLLKEPVTANELTKIQASEERGVPYGSEEYIMDTIEKHNLQSTIRSRGRPKKY